MQCKECYGAVSEMLAPKIAEIEGLQAELDKARQDTEIMDWLERQHVDVRTPLRYGSREHFHASPNIEAETSNLRAIVRRVLDEKGE